MKTALIFLLGSVVIQLVIFIYSKNYKNRAKKDDVLSKYNINTRSELFNALNRQDIPTEDMDRLNTIYTGGDL